MANTGNILPGTGESVDRAGLTAWTNPGGVVSDNATDATCNGAGSDYLVARNFDFSAIPDTATINGVLVRVEASEHSGGTEALLAQLQDEGAALEGSSKSTSNEGAISGTAKAIYTYGSTSDVWGGTLTPAVVKDPDFGVRLWFATSHDVRIDFVTMAIEYTEAAPVSGSGTLDAATATMDGTAVTTNEGSGALQADTATADGSALVLAPRSGSGALEAASATMDGVALQTFLASGALEASPATLDGTALLIYFGSGGLQADTAFIAGVGTAEGGEPAEFLNPWYEGKTIYVLSSVAGLTPWVDYIPVRAVPGNPHRFDSDGSWAVVQVLTDITGLVAWVDYIPVFLVPPGRGWSTDTDGYIPFERVV